MTVTFADPAALLLLLLIPVWLWMDRRARVAFPLPRAGGLAGVRSGASMISVAPDGLRVLCLFAIVLAIARPVTAAAVVEERSEGVPIVLALDVSSSMLAQDFLPRDRLTVAKAALGRFIDARGSDPIGLVAFAGEALTLVPATTHRGVLHNALETVDVGLLEDGTALGDGLAAAVNRARTSTGTGAVVLLSDGESNRGVTDPIAAAEAAAVTGVVVYSVGVGSEGIAPVPIGRAPIGFRYAERPVALDEAMLANIAERTGGRYFRATDPDALERIYEEIDGLLPSVIESTRRIEQTPWSGWLLMAASFAFAIEWLIRGSRWGSLP